MRFREWDGHCQRCGKETTVSICSMFSSAQICMECKDAEERSPAYQEAVAVESAAVKNGDYNFQGIGEERI